MKPTHRLLSFTLTAALGAASAAPAWAAASCSARSGPQRVPVVELYTSEGCNSCPPADAWLGSLADAAAQGRVLPLAFHVDYWDYIGWRDRFAQPAFAARQRELARLARSGTIYTPQVILSGGDFGSWRNGRAARVALEEAAAQPAAAQLEATLSATDPLTWQFTAHAQAKESAQAYVAVFERGLSSEVKAGENAGVQLRHEFVVRRWLGPYTLRADAPLDLRLPLTLERDWRPANLGVALVVNDARNATLQSLAMKFCGT